MLKRIWCQIKITPPCWLIELFSSLDFWILYQHCKENNCILAEHVERCPIIIQNSSNPSSRKNLNVRPYDCTRCYFKHARPSVPLALSYNQSSTRTRRSCEWKSTNITTHFIHSRGFSFVDVQEKKMRASLLGLPKSIYFIMCARKRVVSITIKYLWYSGNISVVTTGECGSQTLPQKALFLKQSMFISFREEVYFIPPYLSSDRICWNLFWVRNRTHPQTPPKLSSLEWIKFQPLENKDKRKLVVWRKLFIFGDRNMSYLVSWW